MLSDLERQAGDLEKKMKAAAAAGDKASLQKYRKELASVNRTMDQLRGAAGSVEKTLQKLDTASPKELQKALRTLKSQLNGLERGSEAWDKQMEKIRAVKKELKELNEEMNESGSIWSKFSGWVKENGVKLAGLAASITGLAALGRDAVDAYADMQQEMANVQKYTGMSSEEVDRLNQAFMEMDTRTPREELNKLAQDAGRLGKSSIEDVLGFVRAADVINVALDDLGDGATLTLSKLTNIFGVEAEYGTEQSLLKVGSVINELSQNCSASAPYLADFAGRLGGVGSQAKLSVQQILAFAAVLDANGQNVEKSATALSNFITKLYTDPAKYANAAGLDVKAFTDLLSKDANAAIIQLLETLNKAGDLDKLAPMFADMKEKGSGMVSTLSMLAKHIDEVKEQQNNANVAFEEGTSVLNEYNIQNSTVQATFEKLKNKLNDVKISLGAELAPLFIKGAELTLVFARAMKSVFDFLKQNSGVIIVLTSAVVGYYTAVTVAAIRTAYLKNETALLAAAQNFLKGATLMAQTVFYGLTGQLTKAKAAMQAFSAVSKANPWGLILGAVTAVVAGIALFINKLNDSKEAAAQAARELEEYKSSLVNIDKESANYAAKELSRLDQLYAAATDEKRSREERIAAVKKMLDLYPEVFSNFSTEEIMAGKAAKAYDNLRESIIAVARARAAQDKIIENEKELLTLEQEEKALKKNVDEARSNLESANKRANAMNNSNGPATQHAVTAVVGAMYSSTSAAEETLRIANKKYEANKAKQKALQEANKELADSYKSASSSITESDYTPTGGGGGGDSDKKKGKKGRTSTKKQDKFEAEKEWRKQEEALARIEYATGESDYIAYTDRMNEIAVEFYAKQLKHKDLTDTESLEITAQFREAQKKQREFYDSRDKEQEERAYNQQMADLKQFYLDGKLTREEYDLKVEEAEMFHQRALIALAAEGSKERADAEKKLMDMQIQQMEARQKKQRELEEKYANMKKEFFGDNPQERQAAYDADLALLEVVYNRELKAAGDNAAEKLRIEEAFQKAKLALKKKYNLEGANADKSALQQSTEAALEWWNSDGAQAVMKTFDAIVSGMSSIFSNLNSLVQADLDLQLAQIDKKYDKEIERAEGNTYQVALLEKKKDEEIARTKNEANKKMFAMQVIMAVAQTAQNAISAYGSALQIGPAGLVLAPIAAAMAVAAGAIQIATIKKQQEASAAQGYAEGGFTPEGDRLKEVGVVHAGEWVASQKLVKNPAIRPVLEALDHAQRTNSVGSLTMSQVSRSLTAPLVLAERSATVTGGSSSASPVVVVEQNRQLANTMDKLEKRLNQPFVTVNTVTGDYGTNKALREYELLMRNKSPKSKK